MYTQTPKLNGESVTRLDSEVEGRGERRSVMRQQLDVKKGIAREEVQMTIGKVETGWLVGAERCAWVSAL